MDKLYELLENKALELSKTHLPNYKESQFLEEFLNAYNAYDFSTYNGITNLSYLGANLLANRINLEFDEFFDLLQKIKPVIDCEELPATVLKEYFNSLKKLEDLGMLENNSPNYKGLSTETKSIYDEYQLSSLDREVFTVEDDEQKYYDAVASRAMIKLFKALPNPELFMSFCELIQLVEYVEFKCDICIDVVADSLDSRSANKIINKKRNQITANVIKEYIASHNLKIYEYYNNMVNYYQSIRKQIKSIAKEANRKIASIERLDERLETISKKSLVRLDSDTDKLLIDSEIEYQYLLFALKHNYSLQSSIEEQNKEYNNNSITKMDILFNKYGFNFHNIDNNNQEKIILIGAEKVEGIIKQIKYSDLNFVADYTDLFVDVILHSNSAVLKTFDTCLKNKFINKNFILSNNKLLYDLDLFEQFFNNLNCLINSGVNLSNKGAEMLLLLNNNELVSKLNILGEYKLKLYEESFSNYELFQDNKLLDYFDNFIELGYGQTIVDNPRYLNSNSTDMIKRIMISDMINLSLLNNKDRFIGMITTGNNFYVGPNEYDKFIIDYKEDFQNPVCVNILNNAKRNIINTSTKNMPIIKKLDDCFMKDSLCYVINDIVISRKRVMRNLEVLTKNAETMNISINDLLFQAILYNMVNNVESEKLIRIYNTISLLNIDKDKTYTFK